MTDDLDRRDAELSAFIDGILTGKIVAGSTERLLAELVVGWRARAKESAPAASPEPGAGDHQKRSDREDVASKREPGVIGRAAKEIASRFVDEWDGGSDDGIVARVSLPGAADGRGVLLDDAMEQIERAIVAARPEEGAIVEVRVGGVPDAGIVARVETTVRRFGVEVEGLTWPGAKVGDRVEVLVRVLPAPGKGGSK